MNPFITERCHHCDDNGQTYIKWAGSFDVCRICGGSKELPNQQGKWILELVKRYGKYPTI